VGIGLIDKSQVENAVGEENRSFSLVDFFKLEDFLIEAGETLRLLGRDNQLAQLGHGSFASGQLPHTVAQPR
jgi:hypothetical protein